MTSVMDRRTFLFGLTLGTVSAPLAAEAQQAGKVYRIGVLSPGTAPSGPLEALRQGLRELGYDEGRNITVEWRFSGASDERLSNLAAELVRLKLDVIVAINTQASLAAKRATTTTPIVMTRVSDPVRTGLVASFAHPGGNITGLSNFSDELSGKRLAVIRELMPAVSRLAVLWNVGNPGIELSVREMGRASTQFGIELHLHGVKSADDVRPSLERVVRERAGALFVFDDVLMMTHKTEILNSATKVRLPVISQYAELTEAGGLMAYGPDVSNMYRRAATYVGQDPQGHETCRSSYRTTDEGPIGHQPQGREGARADNCSSRRTS
jgi:putative ABC transport system substrate-binding protein